MTAAAAAPRFSSERLARPNPLPERAADKNQPRAFPPLASDSQSRAYYTQPRSAQPEPILSQRPSNNRLAYRKLSKYACVEPK